MNKIVILGNGFDLAHNLKTRYSDLILWYLNKVFRLARDKRYNYDDGLLSFGMPPIVANQFNTVNDFLDFTKAYQITIKYKHLFFKDLISCVSDLNWVDIECKYYSKLLDIYR